MPRPQNVTVTYDDPTVKKIVKQVFGREVSDVELAMLVGALDGAKVNIGMYAGDVLLATVRHPLVAHQERIFGKLTNNELFIYNAKFRLYDFAPSGTGLIAFARQVSIGRELEVKEFLAMRRAIMIRSKRTVI